MTTESLKETIKRELPEWLRQNPDFRAYVLDLTRHQYADRAQSEDRFEKLLAELRRDREEQNRKWDEQNPRSDAMLAEMREEFRHVHEQLKAQNEGQAESIAPTTLWTSFVDLPMAYGGPPLKGLLRASAADFQVDEDLGFEPDGAGEHQLLRVRKTDANTEWVAKQLASFLGLPTTAVGYAGQKDRHAIATQWFSAQVPLSKNPDWSNLEAPGIEILEVRRHGRKLRRGALNGNRFRIVLRAVTGDRDHAEERLRQISERGVPNYFGSQRFGNREGNLFRADALFRGEIRRVKRHLKGLWLSAARSQLFNQVLASRVGRDDWDQPIPGDRMQLAGSRSHFLTILVDDELMQRTRALDVHPTGPLWGAGERLADDECAALEDQVLAGFAAWKDGLVKEGLRQERRALRMPVADLEWTLGPGDSIEINFRLGVGCFATSLLREIVDWEEARRPVELRGV